MGCDPARLPAIERQHAGHLTKGAHGARAYGDLLDVPAARMRDRNVRVRRATSLLAVPGVGASARSRSSTRRPAHSAPRSSRPSRRRYGATTSERHGSSADSTSTSSSCSTSTGSSAAPTASTCCRSHRSSPGRSSSPPHGALGADGSSARGATALCAEAERVIVMTETAEAAAADGGVRRGQDPRRPARGAGHPRAPARNGSAPHGASIGSGRASCSRRSG